MQEPLRHGFARIATDHRIGGDCISSARSRHEMHDSQTGQTTTRLPKDYGDGTPCTHVRKSDDTSADRLQLVPQGRLTIARRFQRRVSRDNEGTRPGGTPEPSLGHRANWAIPWLLFSKDHRPVPTVEERPF